MTKFKEFLKSNCFLIFAACLFMMVLMYFHIEKIERLLDARESALNQEFIAEAICQISQRVEKILGIYQDMARVLAENHELRRLVGLAAAKNKAYLKKVHPLLVFIEAALKEMNQCRTPSPLQGKKEEISAAVAAGVCLGGGK